MVSFFIAIYLFNKINDNDRLWSSYCIIHYNITFIILFLDRDIIIMLYIYNRKLYSILLFLLLILLITDMVILIVTSKYPFISTKFEDKYSAINLEDLAIAKEQVRNMFYLVSTTIWSLLNW